MNNESRPTFNQPILPRRCRSAIVLRVEQYVPAPIWFFKCQKYGLHREACRRWHTCVKCGEKDPSHMEEHCLKEIRYANCQDHPLFTKRKRNNRGKTQEESVFPGTKENCKELYGRKVTLLLHGGRIKPIKLTSTEHSRKNWSSWKPMIGQSFRSIWKNYTQLNFIKHQFSNWLWVEWSIVQTKTLVGSTTPTWTTPKSAKFPAKQLLYKSICPPKSIKDRLKKLVSHNTDEHQSE